MSGAIPFLKRITKAVVAGLMVCSIVLGGTTKFAYAQVPLPVVDIPQFTKSTIKDVLVNSAVAAVLSGTNYLVAQLAYQAAVAITSECPGQKNCWNSKSFGQFVRESAQGAVGEAVGVLSEQAGFDKLGFNLCAPPTIPPIPGVPGFNGAEFTLNLQLGLLDDLKPPPPKCDFNQLSSNWLAVKDSLTSQEILSQAKSFFEPGQSPLSTAITLRNRVNISASEAKSNAANQALIEASAGGGFSAITDPISGRIKAPPAFTKAEFDKLQYYQTEAPQDSANASLSGQLASGAVATVVPTALSVFGQTLLSRLWNKLADGLISSEALIAAQPDLILNADGVLQPPGVISTRLTQSRFFSTAPRDIGLIDPLLDFTTCPTSRGLKNCVVDAQFANAIRVADAAPLTVAQALEQNLLHGEWPLISAKNRAKDQDPFCFTSSYCESNLKKLRAARIISIGWEIAASKSPVDKPAKLKDVVAGFNDCNAEGQADADHPWCHLIDPDWVLKIPLTQCRAQVYGPQLLTQEIANRGEVCVDAPTCLQQDEAGNCIGGYGYCTREKNVWRFNGDVCPAQFNTCRSLTQVTAGSGSGTQVNLLMNTVDAASCSADNVGCTPYSTQENINGAINDPSDDWNAAALRFFNDKAENCSPSDGGCTVLFDLGSNSTGNIQSLNLVRNGSFERLIDGDLDGTADHADGWSPYGEIAEGNNGRVSREVGKAQDGSVSLYLNSDRVGSVTKCTLAGGAQCDQESGCTCKTGGFSCAVPMNGDSCAIENVVVQDGLPIRDGVVYSLQATFIAEDGNDNAKNTAQLTLRNANNSLLKLLPSQVTISAGIDSACVVTASGAIELSSTGSARVQIPVCNFFITGAFTGARYASLVLQSNGAFVDSVQLEEGNPTRYHDGYGSVPQTLTAKIAPAYLGCSGNPGDAAQCAQYAPVCRASEVGCERYNPTNGDPSIPAIISSADRCPGECVGYDTFRQAATTFDVEKFPVHFIPATAAQCTAAEVGCEEFTNINTEQKAYFSQLRACQRPEAADTAVYYSWEGSDATGFQLRVWSFKASNLISPNGPESSSDIAAVATATTAGRAPCTNFNGQDGSCADTAQTVASCNRASVDAGDFDCREFYDVDGNRHYRRISKIVIASSDCETFRITTSTEQDCRASGGRWNEVQQQCTYATAISQSVSCNAQAKGCRAYQGGTAGNSQELFNDIFEGSIDPWGEGAEYSPEAVVVGGHSLKIRQEIRRASRLVNATSANRSYTVSFWARGGGSLVVKLDNGQQNPTKHHFSDTNPETTAPAVVLGTEWRQYTLGPVIFSDASFSNQSVFLAFETAGVGDVFIDNVQLKEIRDSVFVVRDSWRTPVSCDRTIDGVPAPQEMLGCKAYTTASNRTEFLRSFGNICREQAIGCSAYSTSQNSPQNFYEETHNAQCRLDSTCTDASACVCNFVQRNAVGAGGEPRIIPDVCRVSPGQDSCTFNLNSAYLPDDTRRSGDMVTVPADERRYLVIRPQDRCDATAASCTAFGKQVNKFEQLCRNTVGGVDQVCNKAEGCQCNIPETNNGCLMAQGATSCTIAFDEPIVKSWETVFKKDDPTKYQQTLCGAGAVGCKAFNGSDGQYFFKFDTAQTCEYKESVVFNGQTRSGWFRKSETGATIPCYEDFIKNGDFFDIAKNGDTSYEGWVGMCKPEFDRCEEFIDPLDTASGDASAAIKGKAYYFLMNDKIDTQSCSGNASLKEGCVLFNRTSDLQKTFSTAATYLKSEEQRDGTSATPENCNGANPSGFCAKRCSAVRNGVCSGNISLSCTNNTDCAGAGVCQGDRYFGAGCFADNECNTALGESCTSEADLAGQTQFNGFTKNDANVIIKVRPDRECGQWFACSAEQTVFDTQLNKWRNVCTGFDLCEENRRAGNAFECVKWVDPEKKLLSSAAYADRDTTWSGMEYSGYSIVNQYPASLIKPVKIGAQSTISSTRFAVVLDPTFRCTANGGDPTDNDCEPDETGNPGRCENKVCYYDIRGGTVNVDTTANAATCRAYPELDAPYPRTILRSPNGDIRLKDRLNAFRGANVCEDADTTNDEGCECGYKRLTYASGAGTKFVSAAADDTQLNGMCVGGPNSGDACDPNTGALVATPSKTCDAEKGGTCARLESKSTAVGWQGLCLDYDTSISINGDPNKFACNTWLPVDQIAGAQDIFNQYKTAGFDGADAAAHKILYCQAGSGSRKGGSYSEVITDETTEPMPTLDARETRLWFFKPTSFDWGGRHIQNLAQAIPRQNLAGVKFEFVNESVSGSSRPFKTLYLLPDPANPLNDWRETVSWGDDLNSTEGIGNAAVANNGAVLGDSPINASCIGLLDVVDPSDANGTCNNYRQNSPSKQHCMAVKANISGNNITGFTSGLCHNTVSKHFVRVKVTLLYREACMVVASVHEPTRTISGTVELSTSGTGTNTWTSAPWTDRVLNPNAVLPNILSGYLSEHSSDRFTPDEDTSPFGFGKPFSEPTGQPTYPVFSTEGGSPNTSIVQTENDYDEKAGTTSAGTVFGCGGTVGGDCAQLSGSKAKASLGTVNDPETANTAVIDGRLRLSNLFATSWFSFSSTGGSNYTKFFTGGVNGASWDRRIALTRLNPTGDFTGTPKILTVDTFNCAAEGACLEGSEGITVNGSSSGIVEGDGGRLKVALRFYGFADKDHMPIRRKIIDFFGNGHITTGTAGGPPPGINTIVRTEGFYKNHRGLVSLSPTKAVCGATESEWGRLPQACDTFFFEETKTYLCSASFRDTLPACGNGYPCRRGNACVFKPKVQLLDNWGACNGVCSGGACINTTLGIDNGAPNGCSPSNVNAWTQFGGEILVRP